MKKIKEGTFSQEEVFADFTYKSSVLLCADKLRLLVERINKKRRAIADLASIFYI